jgi:uncharacterized protein (TIGR02246 family)
VTPSFRENAMSPAIELLKNLVTSDATQIEGPIGNLADAWNRHDGHAYAAAFAEDADFVNVLGQRQRGRAEISVRHLDLFRTVMRNSVLHVLHHSVRFLTETVAVAHVKWEMEGHEPPPGWIVADVRQGILTLVFQRSLDGWKIATAHNTDTITMQ